MFIMNSLLSRTLNESYSYDRWRGVDMIDKPLDQWGKALKLRPWTHEERSGF